MARSLTHLILEKTAILSIMLNLKIAGFPVSSIFRIEICIVHSLCCTTYA